MITTHTVTFTVTEDHLKLLRHAWVSWDDSEFGAPEIDPKRPYGNSDVYGDIGEILDIIPTKEVGYTVEQQAAMRELHNQTQTVLQIAIRTGKFEIGTYTADKYSLDWRKVVD